MPGGYHGYWQSNLYQVNPYFGSANDLKALSAALHARGMWLMVDIVANHMGIPPSGSPSGFYPFSNWTSYHDCSNCPANCEVNDYTNGVQMEHCRLAGLYDLNQSNPWVAAQLVQWIQNITTEYNIDGLRLDTVPYVWPSFWTQFQAAADMYIVGEVDMSDVSWVSSYQGPLDATLSYPMFFTLRDVFANGASMNELQGEVQAYANAFTDQSVLGNFIDNHDNPRFLSQRDDSVAYRAALVWVLLSDGIPIIYYGTEAGFNGGNDPYCREPLWPTAFAANTSALGDFITRVVSVRKARAVWQAPQVQRYSDDWFYAFTRGDTFVALTNVGTGGQSQQRSITYHPYSNGQTLCNALASGDCVTVNGGAFQVTLNNGEAKIYVPSS